MLNLNRYICIIFFLLFSYSPLFADDKTTAVINIDFIIQNSNFGKKVLSDINSLNQKNINQLEERNKKLRELENKIKNKKNVISEQEFNNEVKSFQKKAQEYTNEKNQIVRNFKDFRTSELEKIFKLFNPIIKDYMEKNSIKILLDSKNTFMLNNEVNLTNDILKVINSKIK